MLRAILIENERTDTGTLSEQLATIAPDIRVTQKLSSVKESIGYLLVKPDADLIFSDVTLSDGLAFDIFEHTGVILPVIFMTGNDKYMIRAFETNGIDYLLKPFNKKEIQKLTDTYESLRAHFTHNRMEIPLQNLADFVKKRKNARLAVRCGTNSIYLLPENIVLLYRHEKEVYVLDRFSNTYLCDKSLTELEEELDRNTFFRVNRQYIVNIGFIKSYTTFQQEKLQVDTHIPGIDHSLIIAQASAPRFKKWLQDG